MKRALGIVLVFILLVTFVAARTDTGTTSRPQPGDVTMNGEVTAEDALVVLQAATGKITLTTQETTLADVNADGGVTAEDALLILQFYTRKIASFPGDKPPSTSVSSTSSISSTSSTTSTTSTTPPEPPYDPGFLPLDTQKIEAEDGVYPDTCNLVNHSGGTSIGFTSAGNQYRYSLTVEKSGYYLIGYHMSVTNKLSVILSVDGQEVFSCTPVVTNDWNIYHTNYAGQFIHLEKGGHTLEFEQDAAGLNFDWFSLMYIAEGAPEQIPAGYPVDVTFTGSVAQKGQPLPMTVSGLGHDGEIVSYIWYINGTWLATSNIYAPTALTIMEIGEIRVWVIVKIQGKTYFKPAVGSFTTQVSDPLPVIRINTENSADITSKEDYLKADMAIEADGLDEAQLYDGKIDIRGRGNATWTMYPKKPYKIKLDKKADLFGMGANKHWALLANYRDRTFMRNTLAFDLSSHLGLPTTQSVFVKVILNGQDVGVYELCEQIRVGKTRVDIMDWEDEATDETDLSALTSANGYDTTGGFLIELNGYYDEVSKFKTTHDVPITVKSPEYLNTNDEMFHYLTGYIQDFEDAVYAENFINSKGQHYSELFDVDDLVDYWIVNEFMGNLDSGSWSSTYMYKDIGGDKFHMGPVWDFDSSSGNYLDHSQQSYPNQWVPGRQGKWYRQLYRDKTFVAKLRERYMENRDYLESMLTLAESYYEQLFTQANADHAYWVIPTSFSYDCNLLIGWMSDRIAFMDEQFETVDTAYASLNG